MLPKTFMLLDTAAIEDLHVEFIRRVMGWTVVRSEGVYLLPNGKPKSIPSWEPYFNTQHAVELLERVPARNSVLIRDEKGDWMVTIAIHSTEAYSARHKKLSVAICSAVAKAFGIPTKEDLFK